MIRTVAIGAHGGLVVPGVPLLVITLVATGAGVVAAIVPARRAARIDILDAVAG